jgi:hypothetical protein
MANKRSSGGSRGRDLFRSEVSSLVADLGELTGKEAAPAPGEPAPAAEQPPLAPGMGAQPASPASEAPGAAHPPAETLPFDGDLEGLLELEDLPSFSPSYLPPLPPPVRAEATTDPVRRPPPPGPDVHPPGEWLAAALRAGSTGPGDEAAHGRLTLPPRAWPPLRDPLATRPAPASVVEASAAPPPDPGPGGEPEADAGAATATDARAVDVETGREELGGPVWHVASQPAPAHFPNLAEMTGSEPGPSPVQNGGRRPEPAAGAPAERGQRFRSTPPSGVGAAAAQLASPSPATPAVTASGQLAGSQRLGLPLLPGGAPAPVSTRPWSLADAMKPLPPLAPGAGRGTTRPVTEPAEPGPAPGQGRRPGLPFPALVAILVVLLLVIAVLIALNLHH